MIFEMKKTLSISKLLFLLLFLNACGDSFLDRPPLGSLTEGSFPQTAAEAVSATNGIYNTLRVWQFNTGGFPLLDIMSDDARKGSNPGDASQLLMFDEFSYTPSNEHIENWYRTLYLGIRRSHLVLEKVPDIDMDETLKNRLLGEARFLRGYFYSILARAFGDVPLVLSSQVTSGVTVSSSEQIYQDVVFPDLLFALDNLPEQSEYEEADIGRASKGAARGLLSRLYLFRKDFISAEKYAMEIINSQQYDLEETFFLAFGPSGQFGVESVFEIGALPEASMELGGNQFGNTQGVRGTPNYGWGFNRPAHEWMLFIGADDPRLDASVIFPGEVLDGVLIVGDLSSPDTLYTDNTKTEILEIEAYNQKVYAPGEEVIAQWGHNRKIIRYADVLLMAAEALNENNKMDQALIYLNLVRNRAREGNQTILPDITTIDQNQLREAIFEERRRELFMEGLRFWDLVRTDKAGAVLGPLGFIEGKHELFPLPQSEVDISNGVIVQNPNWN